MVARNVESDPEALEEFIDELQGQQINQPRINVDPEKIEQGLAKLVLTLIELLRKLMEKQAVKRMEAGSLTSEEIERMGLTFMRLEEKMEELKQLFGLKDEDLNLKLGPLGDLM